MERVKVEYVPEGVGITKELPENIFGIPEGERVVEVERFVVVSGVSGPGAGWSTPASAAPSSPPICALLQTLPSKLVVDLGQEK